MRLDRHFGFMHIERVAQSCRLDNKVEFVQSHHGSINPSKKFIGTRISRFTVQSIGASNRLFENAAIFQVYGIVIPFGYPSINRGFANVI